MHWNHYQPKVQRNKLMRQKRFIALIIDVTIIVLIGQLLSFIAFGGEYYIKSAIFALVCTFIICKDCVIGQSIGKYLMRIQIIDIHTGNAASNLKTILRNLFIWLWPVEVVFFLIEPDRRLGDYVSKTRIIDTVEPHKFKPSINDFKAICICFILIWIITCGSISLLSIYLPQIQLLYQ